MTNPKISIIVPVYKAEKYINRCIDSILAQTLTDFELLLIDDGSPDRSGEICDKYAQKDSRIRVFHKENDGVASARQLGMDVAQGEYVIHADPDDWIESQMLQELYDKAKDNDSDVVICDFYVNTPVQEFIVKQEPSNLNHLTVLLELFQQLHGSCCNKLLKRSCYSNYNIIFHKELTYCEDLTFWVQLFQKPVNIVYLPKAFYHYVQHPKSLSKTHGSSQEDKDWKLIKTLKKDLRGNNNILKHACSRLSCFIVEDAFRYGSFTTFSFVKRHFKYIPFLITYKSISLSHRLFLTRLCVGMYGYYKKRINYID